MPASVHAPRAILSERLYLKDDTPSPLSTYPRGGYGLITVVSVRPTATFIARRLHRSAARLRHLATRSSEKRPWEYCSRTGHRDSCCYLRWPGLPCVDASAVDAWVAIQCAARRVRASLDDLVGTKQDRLWNGEAQRIGCIQVHRELEPSRLFDGEITRLCTLEDPRGSDCGMANDRLALRRIASPPSGRPEYGDATPLTSEGQATRLPARH